MELPIDPESVKGFLHPEEGQALHDAAVGQAPRGACLEIGAYCGKSAIYIGTGVKAAGGVLFSIDHHRGSEENQPGWEWHDPALWDEAAQSLDTLPYFRTTLRRAALEGVVVPLVGTSSVIARYWTIPLAFLFIDGGHTMEAALGDYRSFAPHVMPGGILAIHDVFPNPEDGGRPPFEILQRALASDLFVPLAEVRSLRLLRRI